jgi:hypothetical protein
MVQILERGRTVNKDMDTDFLTKLFPHLNQELDDIKLLRERDIDTLSYAQQRRFDDRHGGLGRRVARLPRQVVQYLDHYMPELWKDRRLLRQFLRDNPQFLAVPKESI